MTRAWMWIAGLAAVGAAGQGVKFRNVAAEAGIDFVLENSPTPEKHLIETMPGGVVAFDFDGDGLMDIFFANGAAVPGLEKTDGKYRNRLYRNLGGMRFKDVTESAGLEGSGYAMGGAAADFDNDGRVDLFVAGVRRNHLYRNLGSGKFEDVTKAAGIGSDVWSITGGWLDYDGDGRLDLLVVNYLKWNAGDSLFCGDPKVARSYCHPRLYEGLPNTLYRNLGNGKFEDVSVSAGIAGHVGKGMSVAIADYDGDGQPDIYVTNDKVPSSLFHNVGGKFEEVGLEAGAALPTHGREISAMGADFRDYDNDGRPDIVVAALAGETFPLFRNTGERLFEDVTYRTRMAQASNRRSGWSPVLADLDNDGWKDLFVSCSHVNDTVERFEAAQYKLANAVFVNAEGVFREAAAGMEGGVAAHRGAAVADFDNDGRLDVVVSALGAPAELWRNESGDNGWLGVRLEGVKSNRDGIGARVRVGRQWNAMTTSAGYASSSLGPVHFGLGKQAVVDVEVWWPSGVKQVVRGVKSNRVVTVKEARGE